MSRSVRYLVTLLAAIALAASACAEEQPAQKTEPSAADGGFPVTVEAANGRVEIAVRPEGIVSLSATATEMLFAIGAGDQVTAVDDNSNYPSEAPTTELSAYEPNVEAIAGYDPDLVVISDDIGDLVASLEALEIPVIVQPAAVTLDDTYEQIDELGDATGKSEEAEALAGGIRSDLEAAIASIPDLDNPPTYYHELDPTFFTATSVTFIGEVYSLLGLRNIADPADKDGSGYPQLSAEYIVKADPDLIFLADTKCCGESADSVAQRPGWDRIEAVQGGSVVELDDDIASRWGPRIVEFLEVVASAVQGLAAA
ncbi:MAG: ABC transporter substrate-binding protein [Actinomycetota bacterium]